MPESLTEATERRQREGTTRLGWCLNPGAPNHNRCPGVVLHPLTPAKPYSICSCPHHQEAGEDLDQKLSDLLAGREKNLGGKAGQSILDAVDSSSDDGRRVRRDPEGTTTMSTTTTSKKTAKAAPAKKAPAKKAASTEPKPHVVKAGGAKGQAILAALKPGRSRQQVADEVGATVGRVGEVVRWLRDNGSAEEKKVVKAFLDGTPKRVAAEKAPVEKTAKKAPAKKAAAKKAPAKPATPRR